MYIQVSKDERATVLAALRFYQEKGQGEPFNRSDAIHDIATNGQDDEVISLDAAGIDELCERINTTNGTAEIIVMAQETRAGTEIHKFESDAERLAWMDSYARSNFGFEVQPDHDDYESLLLDEFTECDEPLKWEQITVSVPPAPAPAPAKVWVISMDTKEGTFSEVFTNSDDAWRGILQYCTRANFSVEGLALGSDEMKEAIYNTLEEDEAYYSIQHVDVVGDPAVPEIAIIMDGGLIQNVTARNGAPVIVHSIDYDTEGGDEADMSDVVQSNGTTMKAYVSGYEPEIVDQVEFWEGLAS